MALRVIQWSTGNVGGYTLRAILGHPEFEVRWSDSLRRPRDAAFAVRHRDRWFYIGDGDQTTKSTFLLLANLFTLQAGDVEEVKPVVTLPVGR